MNTLKVFSKSCMLGLSMFVCGIMISFQVSAQTVILSQKSLTAPFNYSTDDFSYCEPEKRDFRLLYDFCPNTSGMCGPTSCGANPYKIEARLFRGTTLLAVQERQVPSAELTFYFDDINISSGAYRVEITFRKRRASCITGWVTVQTRTSNIINVAKRDASPDFNVNGTSVPTDGSPINVCASYIRVNAAATSCENSYSIVVEECNRWWSRTYDYEWTKSFNGKAPNNINLQQLATTYSYPPYFTGSSSRHGSPLIGGNLPGGSARYYRVRVCTNDPSWTCKTALIRVDGSCKKGMEEVLTWEEDEVLDPVVNLYPNPAREKISIEYSALTDGMLSIDVYDLSGKNVKTLLNKNHLKGRHNEEFDISDLENGAYIVVLRSPDDVKTTRLNITH